jgi:hypothetical protein
MNTRNYIEKWTNKESANFFEKAKLQVLHLTHEDYSILNEKG